MRRRVFLFVIASLAIAPAVTEGQTEPVVIFLVRHAERADDGAARDMWAGDPPLSEAGAERAALLSEMLRDAGITEVHTTDYRRTRSTARPLADAVGLPLQVYDPSDPEGFATRLVGTPGRHLVVGHSNTTPELVRALSGDPGGTIAPLEYDRLYVLTVTPSRTSTALLRFGTRYVG